MLSDAVFALWFFLPAGAANVAPILVANIPWIRRLNAPMDFGKSFRGKRILGPHKTWRGMLAGIIFATLTLWLQKHIGATANWIGEFARSVDYAQLNTWILGPLFAIGALGGDAVESFFKRQRHVPAGHGWFPFDQLDYIIGGAIATAAFVQLTFLQYLWLFLLWLLMHLGASYIGYVLGLKHRPV